MGATTVWERWNSMLPDGTINAGEMTSVNHYALGSIGQWMHRVIGGLSEIDPGWRRSRVKPIPGGTITRAQTVYESRAGRIECEWATVGDTFKMTVKIPINSEAEVSMPGGKTVCTRGSGTHIFEEPYRPPPWPPAVLKGMFSMAAEEDEF